MSIIKKIEKEQIDYYSEKGASNEDAFKVGWKNFRSQQVRFEQLLRSFTISDGDTIIDLGCGLGDLYDFLSLKYPSINFKYIGYDVMPEMIENAKSKHTQSNVSFFVVNEVEEIKNADYIFASGIFNLKHSLSDNDWLSYIKNTVVSMSQKSKKGISFNCLTSFSDVEFRKPELYYTNPMELFEFCKKDLSRNVALYHDYEEYDFTISIKK